MKEIRTAMGYVETVGLAAAVAAADAALKAANVRLIGRENSKGGGMVTLKFSGNVGALRAAVAAARAEGGRVNEVVTARIIARPASTHGPIMGYNADTMGVEEWLQTQGVQDSPVSVYRPEGKREETADRGNAKSMPHLPEETEVPASSQEADLSEMSPEPLALPEEVPGAEPDMDEALSKVQQEKPEGPVLQEEETETSPDDAASLEQPSGEPVEETGETGTPGRKRRTTRRKAAESGGSEGRDAGGTPKRRTRRKKASDSGNNETSGRS